LGAGNRIRQGVYSEEYRACTEIDNQRVIGVEMDEIEYRVNRTVSNDELNELFEVSWPGTKQRKDFRPILDRSLVYICAYKNGRLVGFVNLVWDGGIHGFILDTTVIPEHRRKGIGLELLQRVADVAREKGIKWLHVDFIPELKPFYRKAGYRSTEAGLLNIKVMPN
jgi:GNAT superfamily N-acetyltransferase